MLLVLKQYLDDDMQVTEYTKDGETVSHVVKVPIKSEIPDGEVIPVQPTFEQRLYDLHKKNGELESALVEMSTYAAVQEEHNIQNERAIMELTTMIAGGNE